ncbi:MAG: hypothetical protein A2X46_19230 [Lentisphaerae bacterium GWF2_57_35]|nr:MAG: hypothetical protein A2X46_19230 [Lentisphaerae bacterium GWF2_57_35]
MSDSIEHQNKGKVVKLNITFLRKMCVVAMLGALSGVPARGQAPAPAAGWPVWVENIEGVSNAFHKPYVSVANAAGGSRRVVVALGTSISVYSATGSLLNQWEVGADPLYYPITAVDLDGNNTDELVTNMQLDGTNGGLFYAYSLEGALPMGWPARIPLPPGGEYARSCSPIVVDERDYPQYKGLVANACNRYADGVNSTYLCLLNPDGQVQEGWPIALDADLPASDLLNRMAPSVNDDHEASFYFATEQYGLGIFNSFGYPQIMGDPPQIEDIGVSVALGDIDNDSDAVGYFSDREIVVGGSDGHVYAYDVLGEYWNRLLLPVPGWPITVDRSDVNEIALADLDGDLDLEIVFTAEYALPGGTEGDEKLYAYHHDATPVAGWPQSLGGGMHHNAPVVADVNGDGAPEIVVCRGENGIAAFSAAGNLLWEVSMGANAKGGNRLVLDDVDGDGLLELLAGDDLGYVYVWNLTGPYKPHLLNWPCYKHDGHFTGRQRTAGAPPSIMYPPQDATLYKGEYYNAFFEAMNPDADPITLTASGVPAGASCIVDNNDTILPYGNFYWIPASDQAGVYPITFTASDGLFSTSHTAVVTVLNRTPVLEPITNYTINLDESCWPPELCQVSLNITAMDDDNDVLTFGVSPLPDGAYLSANAYSPIPGMPYPQTVYFLWRPTTEQAGDHVLTFSASDGDVTVYQTMTVTVATPNEAPVLNPIGNQFVAEGSALTFSATGFDPDGQALFFNAAPLPSGSSFTTNGMFSWSPSYAQAGVYTVTFTVSDGAAQDAETITITVADVNQAPVLNAIGNQSVAEGSALTFSATGSDPDGQALFFNAAPLPSGASFTTNGTFYWSPSYAQAGVYTVTFTVSDGAAQDAETITITVANVNQAPVLNPIGNQSVAEGSALTFSATGSDPDGQALIYSATSLPSGAMLATNGTFTWTPTSSQVGTHTVTIACSDGTATDSETIVITVSSVNHAPVLNTIGSKSVRRTKLLSFTVSGSDPDGDSLTYSASPLPAGATFVNRTFSWRPTSSQVGYHYVTFTVRDNRGGTDSETVRIRVTR